MAAAGKFEGPEMQNKRPGIDAVDRVITAFRPLNHNIETLKFYFDGQSN